MLIHRITAMKNYMKSVTKKANWECYWVWLVSRKLIRKFLSQSALLTQSTSSKTRGMMHRMPSMDAVFFSLIALLCCHCILSEPCSYLWFTLVYTPMYLLKSTNLNWRFQSMAFKLMDFDIQFIYNLEHWLNFLIVKTTLVGELVNWARHYLEYNTRINQGIFLFVYMHVWRCACHFLIWPSHEQNTLVY